MLIREKLTPSQRATPLRHTIDPGFVHHSKIQTILGPQGMSVIDNAIKESYCQKWCLGKLNQAAT